jgi:hypothetical protein
VPEEVLSYSLPRDIIVRLLLIPSAISVMLLPKLVSLHVNYPKIALNNQLFNVYLFQAAPFCFFLSALGPELLLYISAGNVSPNASYLFDLFLLSLLILMPGFVLHTNLLAEDKPKHSALRHIVQLPFYASASYWIATTGRIDLMGYLWLSWCITDLIMLEWISRNFLKKEKGSIKRYFLLCFLSILFVFVMLIKEAASDEVRYAMSFVSGIFIILNFITLLRQRVIFRF